jgi:ribosomal protein S19
MIPTQRLLARSVWKGPHIVPYVSSFPKEKTALSVVPSPLALTQHPSFKKKRILLISIPDTHRLPIARAAPGEKEPPPIRTQARSATILPNFVGLKFQVHNGKIYHDVRITEEMVGHKLGEFSP